jgi:hypothetical protein
VAKLRKGLDADGKADLDAARAIQPTVASQAKAIGLTRPTTDLQTPDNFR